MTTETVLDHNSIQARKKRWLDLQKPDARPGFVFEIKNIKELADEPPVRPLLRPDLKQERIDWGVKVYDYWIERAKWLHDDFVPGVMCVTGTDIFGQALGCDVHYAEIANPCAIPNIMNSSDAAKVTVPELSNSTLAYLFDMAEEIASRIDHYDVYLTPDLQSPMDIVAMMWDKSTLFLEMIDNPQAVKDLAHKCETLLINFIDEWIKRFGRCMKGPCSQGVIENAIKMSVDEVGAVNKQMFDEFFLGELETLSNRYGGMGIHCCADAPHQWENWKKVPGLKMLNLHKPTKRTNDYCRDAYKYFADTCLQCHIGWMPEGPVETWLDQYPDNARFQIAIDVDTKAEAIEICDKLNQIRGTV